jgi:hypothetical protein
MQLWSRNKLFHSFESHGVTEMSIPKLALEAALLLFFYSTPRFKRKPNDPFEIVIRDRHLGLREEELRQAADSLCHSLNITTAEGTTEIDTSLDYVTSAL